MDEQEAVKANSLPESVQANEPVPFEEAANENELAKSKIEKYGFTDVEKFTTKATSDPIFGKQVLRDLLGLEDAKPFYEGNVSGARQENNITGVLVHSEHPPVLRQTAPAVGKPAGNTPEAA